MKKLLLITIILVLQSFPSFGNPNGIGILYWGETIAHGSSFNLSELKSDSEAACNLFKGLRLLGRAPVTNIYVHLLPEYGLGRAVNDRLQRAANK